MLGVIEALDNRDEVGVPGSGPTLKFSALPEFVCGLQHVTAVPLVLSDSLKRANSANEDPVRSASPKSLRRNAHLVAKFSRIASPAIA